MGSLHGYASHSDLNNLAKAYTVETVHSGTKNTQGFLHKIFSREPNWPKPAVMELEDGLKEAPSSDDEDISYSDLNIMPCPYIRPLQNRLEPRDETHALAPRRPFAESAMSISRKKGESSRLAHGYLSLNKAGDEGTNLFTPDIVSLRSLRVREDIAAAATADFAHLKDWSYYIKCYSEGRYNLINPPGPPPMNPDFKYLPATYPTNEAERLAKLQSSDIWSGTDMVWSDLDAARARSLIKAAAVRFSSLWGAISFFDYENEVVQAERGYSRHIIPRRESIASHVLLTSEVMTILDTQKDWRFAGNPLVLGHPKIRFFAGAPLLSPNSEVIGVFAIFSPTPRESFTAMQRRELTRFGEMAMQDLTSFRRMSRGNSIRSIVTFSPESGANRMSDSTDPFLKKTNSTHRPPSYGLFPPTARYQESSLHRKSRSRATISATSQDPVPNALEYTPPHSDDSDAGFSPFMTQVKGLEKNHKQLSLLSESNLSRPRLEKPDSPTFGNCPPYFIEYPHSREFSGSDLTSVDQEKRPCTPESCYAEETSLSAPDMIADAEIFSSDEAAVLLTPHPNTPVTVSQDLSPEQIYAEIRAPPTKDNFFLELTLGSQFLPNTGTKSTLLIESGNSTGNIMYDSINRLRDSRAPFSAPVADSARTEGQELLDPTAEARFAAEFWAKNLKFDTIYAVELIPKRLFMDDAELKAPGGVDTRVLVSYGLRDPVNFDIPMHLNVLRGSGAMTWENNDVVHEEYQEGLMMPLNFDFGTLEYRSCGIVFGAFRRPSKSCSGLAKLNAAEIDRLRQAASVLENILHKSIALNRAIQSDIEVPVSPCPRSYPANEAIEVSEFSLDTSSKASAKERRSSRQPPTLR